jgi:hypothetical protein
MHTQFARLIALNLMGCLWGYMGMNLLKKGVPALLINASVQLALFLIAMALIIGFFKSIFVLKKAAARLVLRVEKVNSYLSIFKLFDVKFGILIIFMMGLGIGMSMIPGFELAKGTFRTAIGYALLQSSFFFFRPAFIYGIRG